MSYRAPRYLFRRHELLRRLHDGERFVEIGAANLALTRELLQHFDRGLAIDFSDDLEDRYAELEPSLRARLEISNVDVMQAPLAGQYDCVVACEVMEHIEDDRGFLERVADMLHSGGQALVSVPAKQEFWTAHDEMVGHLRRYEKADLIALAKECGFTDIEVIAYGYPWINWLSHLRVWLAKRTMTERLDWDQQQQTQTSNHRQIPPWLSRGAVGLLSNRFSIYPFALISRVFNHSDRSDGYIVNMRRGSDT